MILIGQVQQVAVFQHVVVRIGLSAFQASPDKDVFSLPGLLGELGLAKINLIEVVLIPMDPIDHPGIGLMEAGSEIVGFYRGLGLEAGGDPQGVNRLGQPHLVVARNVAGCFGSQGCDPKNQTRHRPKG